MVVQIPDGWTEFRFYRPGLKTVMLAGDFNGWHTSSLPMSRGDDGWWRYRIRLAPGCYQFRYLGDDGWYTDFAAFGVEPTPLGLNSVVKIDPPETEREAPTAVRFPHITEDPDAGFEPAFDPTAERLSDPQVDESELELQPVAS